ncbi:MAG: Hint domain-containing protein [Alphaproteobacteria bacterium]
MATISRRFGREEDEVQPTGLLQGTLVRTLDGVLPVEFLEPGDRVVTRAGARRLGSISVSRRRGLPMVRFPASTLGHDRPEQDLFLAPGTPVVIRDWRARAIYGTPVAVLPAERLADGDLVRLEILAEARIFTLRFAEDEVIWAEGLEIACPAMETETTQP